MAREKFLQKAAEDLIDEENEKLMELLALQNRFSLSLRTRRRNLRRFGFGKRKKTENERNMPRRSAGKTMSDKRKSAK